MHTHILTLSVHFPIPIICTKLYIYSGSIYVEKEMNFDTALQFFYLFLTFSVSELTEHTTAELQINHEEGKKLNIWQIPCV